MKYCNNIFSCWKHSDIITRRHGRIMDLPFWSRSLAFNSSNNKHNLFLSSWVFGSHETSPSFLPTPSPISPSLSPRVSPSLPNVFNSADLLLKKSSFLWTDGRFIVQQRPPRRSSQLEPCQLCCNTHSHTSIWTHATLTLPTSTASPGQRSDRRIPGKERVKLSSSLCSELLRPTLWRNNSV